MIFLTIVCLMLSVILIYMALIEPNLLVTKSIVLSGNVKQPIRIVHISDTHFHAHFSRHKLVRWITLINQYDPDFIVFSGDLIDHYNKAKHLRYEIPPYLRALQAKRAKLAIYGNHDIGGGAKAIYETLMQEGGFYVLRNERVIYEDLGIAFLGIDDVLAGYEDKTIVDRRIQPMQIVLAHEPDIIDSLNKESVDLMLSGHTHGGQVLLPYLTKKRLPKGGKHYRKGLYHIDHTCLYVNCGIGTTSLPLRFANPPEITVYELYNKQ